MVLAISGCSVVFVDELEGVWFGEVALCSDGDVVFGAGVLQPEAAAVMWLPELAELAALDDDRRKSASVRPAEPQNTFT